MFDLLTDIFTGDPAHSQALEATSDEPGSRSTIGARHYEDDAGEAVGGGLSYLKEWLLGDGLSATRGADVHAGAWFDGEGDVHRGVRASGHAVKLGQEAALSHTYKGVTTTSGWEASLGDATAEARIEEGQGLSLGAQANAASVALHTGTSGTATDERSKIGFSEGVGAAARLHWGDTDNDQRPEYGFGFDLGPIAYDVASEDPLRKALELGSLGVIGGGPPTTDRVNLTEGVVDAGRAVGSGADHVSDALAGVDDTQGTRGGSKTFGQMNELELTMAAMFNPGLNPEVRRGVFERRIDAIQDLFGGQYD